MKKENNETLINGFKKINDMFKTIGTLMKLQAVTDILIMVLIIILFVITTRY